jgi:glycosyltransferase involved in cell wall biosynthesis
MTDGRPPDFAIFGRSTWSASRMPWHWLAHELAIDHPVSYVYDPRRRLLPAPTCPAEEARDGVLHVTPHELPLSRFAAVRRLSEAAFVRTLRRRGHPPGPRTVAVLFPRSPLGLARALRPAVTVYWASDEFLFLPSGETNTIFAAWEREAVARADLVIGSSRLIAERIAQSHGVPVHRLPNGFSAALLDRRAPAPPPRPAGPVVGCAGTLDPDRLDLLAVAVAARARPDVTFLFAGHQTRPGDPRIAALSALPNARVLDPVPVERIGDLVSGFDVALLPYHDTPMNRACSPLKAMEALALGKVLLVSPAIDELREFRPAATFFEGPADIVPALDRAQAIRGDRAAVEPCFAKARERTWPAQVRLFLDLLRDRRDR